MRDVCSLSLPLLLLLLLENGSLGLKLLAIEHLLDLAGLQRLLESLLYVHLGEDLTPRRLAAHKRLELRLLRVPLLERVAREDRVWSPLILLRRRFHNWCLLAAEAVDGGIDAWRVVTFVQSEGELLD